MVSQELLPYPYSFTIELPSHINWDTKVRKCCDGNVDDIGRLLNLSLYGTATTDYQKSREYFWNVMTTTMLPTATSVIRGNNNKPILCKVFCT
jgi:hypothetical protein